MRSTGLSGSDAPAPLAEAKLVPPRLRADTVERTGVLQAFDAGAETALTLVAAPAGFGKTTAVRAWCASREDRLAWVTLDRGDNDPVRLWTYIATAVDRVRQGLGRGALQRLEAGGQIEAAVDVLMNGVAAFRDEFVLVLDDFQHVTDAECVASVDYALGRVPPTMRVFLLTRIDPELRIAQLRTRGALTEVRADDLAFDHAEAHELLVTRGRVPLRAEELETLCRRTDGWPAALYLALLWLRRAQDPGQAVRDFGGDHRFVADYLNHEVLSSLDAARRRYLLQASVLGRFTAEICDGVLGRGDSAAMLDDLERSNLFVSRLEHGGWFNVHPLFAEFARFQLASLEPDAPAEIHRRAAQWFDARGLPLEAVEHAAAAGDDAMVADLLSEHLLPLMRGGRARTLLHWARTLTEQRLVDHPEVAVGAACAAAVVGRSTIEMRRFLRVAERARRESPARATASLEAGIGMVRAVTIEDGVNAAVAAGREAAAIAPAASDDLVIASLGGYARALYFAGDLDGAWQAALEAVEHPEAEHRPIGQAFARTTLALVALERGRPADARVHVLKAKALIGRVGNTRSWLGANASAAYGSVLAAEGKLVEAERELAYAAHFFRDEVPTVHHAWLLVLTAEVSCRRGRLDAAESTLREAHEAIAAFPDTGRVAALAAAVERELTDVRARAVNGAVGELPSDAELAVLRLLASDLSTRQIGQSLYLSPNTVRSHTRAIYRKLGVNSRADAVARSTTLGLLADDQAPVEIVT